MKMVMRVFEFLSGKIIDSENSSE